MIGYLVQHPNGRCAEFNAATRQWVPMLSPDAKYATVVTREQAEDVAAALTTAGYPAIAVEDAYFRRAPAPIDEQIDPAWESHQASRQLRASVTQPRSESAKESVSANY